MNSDSAARLEDWVRQEMGLTTSAQVDIVERAGTDPRCSPVVTEVTISAPGETPYSVHIEHPLPDVERMDFVAALAFGGH